MTSCASVLVFLSVCTASMALLPFGTENGDEHAATDSSGYIKLPFEIGVDGKRYERCEVHTAGHISLLDSQSSDARIQAWGAMATGGEPTAVYARLASDQDIAVVDKVVRSAIGYEFTASSVLIATWINTNEPADELPTTQCVIVSDGYESHAIFLSCSTGDLHEQRTCTSPKEVQLNPLVREPVTIDAYSTFQLRYSGRCLSLSSYKGYYGYCTDSNGNAEDLTLYQISGSPGYQKLYVVGTSYCLDREHCHSSTSNLRRSSCSHCGAIHWEYHSNGKLTEDDENNCIYYSGSWTAAVHHTSDGCTYFTRYYMSTSFSYDEFPEPELSHFINHLPTANLKGLRVYQDDGMASFEVVHALPENMEFPVVTKRSVYQVEYWVTDIKTNVPYADTLVPGMIINWLASNQDVISSVGLRYGAVDIASGEFGEIDGVLSIFVKNDDPGQVKIPVDEELLRMLVFQENGDEWWLTAPRFHFGEYRQAYYSFVGSSPIYPGLYWTRQYE